MLTSVVTRAGLTTTLTYTAGLLTTVTDAFGHALTLGYDDGLLASVTLPDGGVIHYAYDDYHRPVSVTYPDNASRQYAYGDARNQWLLTGITDESNQQFATYTYGANGAVISETHAGGANQFSFSYGASSTTVTDPLGTPTQYGFSGTAGVMRKTSYSQPCQNCGGFASRTYDAFGNVASQTDFRSNQTVYTFDTVRNLETSRTEAYGTPRARTTTTQWDSTFRLPAQIDEPGRGTVWTYDNHGNPLTRTVTDTATTAGRTTTFTYNSVGQVLTVDGPRTDVNDVTTFTYYSCAYGSECGRVATVTDPSNNQISYLTYDENGLPLTMTDANNVLTTLTYDARQRLASRDVAGEVTTLSYYPTGLLKRVTLPDSSYVEYSYDAAHRLIGIEDGEQNKITYILDGAGNRTVENVYDPSQTLAGTRGWIYDTLGRVLSEIDAGNNTVGYTYDLNGNLASILDQEFRPTTFGYDELNRQTSIVDPMGGLVEYAYTARDELQAVTDPRSLPTTYQYNGFGDLKQLGSPDTGTTQYATNASGQIHQATDARNKTATYSYDPSGRIAQVLYPDQTIQFTYDQGSNGKGRLTQLSDASGITHWTYTPQGRVAGKQQTVGSVTLSVGYGYNAAGQMTQLTTPSGQIVGLSYGNGRPRAITVNGAPLLSGVLYTPFGPTSGWSWANGTLAVREYDLDGRVTTIDSAGLSTYQFYPDGRIQSWTDDSGSLGGASGLTEFNVDPDSNRLTASDGLAVRTYSYDEAGNIIGDGTRTFTYNAAGRMMSATASGTTTAYALNGLGQRVRKTTSGTSIYFVYDESGHLLGEYNNAGNLIQETVWLEDIPVAVLKPNGSGGVNVFYIHSDHLNTPRRISRPSDNVVVWRWDSDPFGTTAPNEDPDGDLNLFVYNLRFPGQYYDSETGLHYNYFRDYDSATGRYPQSDPIGLLGGINTYSYVGNNPITNFDPTGQNTIAIGAGIGTAVEPGGGTAVGAAIGGIIMGGVIVYEMCKDKACPPCTPYAEGTIGYLGPDADNHFNKKLGRYLNPHLNLFEVNQNKADCKCRWNKSKLDSAEPPPLPGWVDLNNGFPALSP